MSDQSFTLDAIGYVSSVRTAPTDDFWGQTTAVIRLDQDRFSASALKGLEDFSHVEVLYRFHKVDKNKILWAEGRPRGNQDWPSVGIFAQRKKDRPNLIGTTFCKVIAVNGLELVVSELDAIDGTPVLDIKPCLREFLPRAQDVRQPQWATELMKDYWSKK